MSSVRITIATLLFTASLFAAVSAFAGGHDVSRGTSPAVASDGLDFLASWLDGSTLRAARFTGSGVLIDAAPITIASAGIDEFTTTYGGGQYLIVYRVAQQLLAVRVGQDGIVREGLIVIPSGGIHGAPAAAWNGSRFLVVWPSSEGMRSAFIDSTGAISAPHILATALPEHSYFASPDVAWDGVRFVVLWSGAPPVFLGCTCLPPVPNEVEAIRVGSDGTPIDAQPVRIASGNYAHIASSGTEFLLTVDDQFTETPRVGVSIIRAAGQTISVDAQTSLPFFFPLWNFNGQPMLPVSDVVWNGTEYTVAMRSGSNKLGGALATGWLATVPVTRTGVALPGSYIPVAPPHAFFPRLSTPLASNVSGQTVATTAEFVDNTDRVRAYIASEMIPLPQLPTSPATARGVKQKGGTLVTWSASDDLGVDGYLVEGFGGARPTFEYVPAGRLSVTLDSPVAYVRVRAFNVSGYSDPPIVVAVDTANRRRVVTR